MAPGGFVDWRGNTINKEVHGGVRAAWFLYVLTVVSNVAIIPNLLNLVSYLHGTMHMGVSGSATTTTNVFGATSGFALIGAFLSDSYITRSRTMLLFGPFMFLGYGLLALQAYLPSLHPPPCNIETELNNCKETNLTMKIPLSPANGPASLTVAAGLPFYRNQVPEGSPLTRILQVLVVAFRNRKLELPEKLEEAQESCIGTRACSVDALSQTDNLKFLNKACINHGKNGDWSVCSVAKVEDTKIVLRVLPLFISSMISYISNVILFTFTVQQGGMTNTRLGKIHVSPATLFIIPTTFQLIMLAVYDQFIVPFLRRRTGYVGGVTHLQRIGIGFASMLLASVIAAIVEKKRKEAVVQMSLFWLAPQFFLLGVADVTSFTGLLEFFNSEAPRGMKSIATALFWCELGLASLMATLLVEIVNSATRHGHHGGWLEGTTLNSSHLDLFYWVVAVLGLLGFFNYLYWAKKYVYQHNPHIVETYADQDPL
ncbi:protein NRT1/ PTR FAMILY 4.6-like isoform X2 [Lolium rigidum]|uniref:protein NRT1/ PTR FAMILY 4.6-like isoform X2 n=1 Tax=Lolium rigidum TaxID=89674 RepID=UPI001F5DC57E|nr:protein NRT1/ PTR FAMILY 4.6-like isoform X2 [Lolium rigidum]